jgi:transcriptional regulator with GAF, ATPase, and Fis domain
MSRSTDRADETATVEQHGVRQVRLPVAAYLLQVIGGADRGREFKLDARAPSRQLIGKGPACDIRLSDASVSRRHASVEVVDGRVRIRDLDSTNATHVNDIRVSDALLVGGEVIRLGGATLRVTKALSESAAPIPDQTSFGALLGASEAMRKCYPLFERLALSDLPVVIEGETGTGKEQLAEALHERSRRAREPFVVFDCTSVTATLMEAELFGHERGAFTGSVATHQGLFERAHSGTLLIDEIGDLPLELQPKLLRAIERAQVTRIGGARPIQVDVRVLAATRRDLDHEVQMGRFRDDLFHRIAVARVELPPLRERHGDVRLLAAHFCRQLGAAADALPEDLLARWQDYNWPGNVRELRNAVARHVALGDITAETEEAALHATPATRSSGATSVDPIIRILTKELPFAEARQCIMDDFELRYVRYMLERYDGNVTRAAAAAGIVRRYFHRIKARVERRAQSDEEPNEP